MHRLGVTEFIAGRYTQDFVNPICTGVSESVAAVQGSLTARLYYTFSILLCKEIEFLFAHHISAADVQSHRVLQQDGSPARSQTHVLQTTGALCAPTATLSLFCHLLF